MILGKTNFGPCWDASGVRGWIGEGYWFHWWCKHFIPGFDFSGSTRVAKTTTFPPNEGNMCLRGREKFFAPIERFPACIWFNPFSGRTLNSVGLSGPGAKDLCELGLLVATEPAMISFMAVGNTREERLDRTRKFVELLKSYLAVTPPWMVKNLALQDNESCPNTGHDPKELAAEALERLEILKELGLPIAVKLNVFTSVKVAKEIANHPACAALCVSNALPFDEMAKHSPDWARQFFPQGSPLRNRNPKFGGGGYSGPELLQLVAKWIRDLRLEGVEIGINAGGGIRSARDVDWLVKHAGLRRGKDSIFFASAAMIRPWNVRGIIQEAHRLLGEPQKLVA